MFIEEEWRVIVENNSTAEYSNDSTALETISVILPSFLLTFLAVNLTNLLHITSVPKILVTEFLIIVIPNLCNVTILVSNIYEVLSILLVLNALVYNLQDQSKFPHRDANPDHHPYITNARSTINLLSVIAILAVDFYVFPRRFTKSAKYGYSLMDVGVGLFVYANGIVAPEIRGHTNSLVKTIKNTLPLLLLGTARFLVTKQINYQVPESEYGLHWNFFITLAVTKLSSSLILNYFNTKFAVLPAVVLVVVHEVFLQLGLAEFVLSQVDRDNFFRANREGIVSSLGYVCLYLLSVSFGALIYKKEVEGRFSLKLFGLSVLTLVIALILEVLFGTSRRLANAGYCFWVLFIGIFMTSLYYLCEFLHNRVYRKSVRRVPLIFEAINYNGLVFFLVSNFLTGFVNMTITTHRVGDFLSVVILMVYLFTTCGFICVLYFRRVRLKL